jgi:Spy/CpxP family protein refolding chaperone
MGGNMTKRQIFTGGIAAFLIAGMSLMEAQGRVGGGVGGGLGGQQRMGGRQGGGRAGQLGGGGRGARMGGGRGDQMSGPLAELAQLDLSADQREKVRDVMEADRTANMDALQALADARHALNAAIYAATPDAAAIASLQAKVVNGESAQLAREVKTRQAIAEILTPEQKAKLTGK